MTNWTSEQQQAINLEGKNIIVSAGAGSGKTAVLSERVFRKLKDGIDINKLLVLTFSKEAALEMKIRIRGKIEKDPTLKEQLNYIEEAYITTFDSFSLSIVKKYNYLLNVSKKVNIIDSTIIEAIKNKILDEIFNKYYEEKNPKFLKLIKDFCMKDDKSIKNSIKSISSLLDLKENKEEYLNTYIDKYYNDSYLDNLIKNYEKLLLKKIGIIKEKYCLMESFCDEKYYEELTKVLSALLDSKTYVDIKNNSSIILPRINKNVFDDGKKIKSEIDEIIKKEIIPLLTYENEQEIKETLLSTKDYVSIIIDIINELDSKLFAYKMEKDAYEFIDISKMAIKIVEENEEIRNELKEYYNEILVDEYQDTNDLQEQFIDLIKNNNVYMVGDVKQSIYRFRNANPLIFKNKYDLYNNEKEGIKIDLLKNFRSREEVVNNINLIFNIVMNDFLGGADYKTSHQMIFGNKAYNKEGKTTQNNNLEIYNYNYDKKYLKEEIEAFIIGNDIKEKIENKYQVFDKEKNNLRDITYNDFCIIMDRKNAFETYKQIFEYLKIPLVIYADEVLTSGDEILVIRNIINFIIKIKNKDFKTEFKYCYVSIARSFLIDEKDNEIFKNIKNKAIFETNVYKTAKEISDNLDSMSSSDILDMIIDKFNIYEKLITVGDIEKSMIRIENLKNISQMTDSLDFTISMFSNYLNEMIDNNYEIKYSLNTKYGNNVKIMNIHKSKGLEFNICYYSGLYKDFNIRDLKERFLYKNEFGIITPYYKEGIGNLITKELMKEKYMEEEISEKIRLFYVGLTRCKEKLIMVTSFDDEETNEAISDNVRTKYRSFLDILQSIKQNLTPFIKNIDISKIVLTKDYKERSISSYELENVNTKIIQKENNIENKLIKESHVSKETKKIETKEDISNMEYGTYIHYLLEVTDFYNPVVPKENINMITKFLSLIDLNNVKIYKEHEFIFMKDDKKYHGIIDLILEYEDHIIIIDYKLKNISDENYIKQLAIYKEYLKSKTDKKIETYLYSILEENLFLIN